MQCMHCDRVRPASSMYRLECANGNTYHYCTKTCMKAEPVCGACGRGESESNPIKFIHLSGRTYRAVCEHRDRCYLDFGMRRCLNCGTHYDQYFRDSTQSWEAPINQRPQVCSEECLHGLEGYPFSNCEQCSRMILPIELGGRRSVIVELDNGEQHRFCNNNCVRQSEYMSCGNCGHYHTEDEMVIVSYNRDEYQRYCTPCFRDMSSDNDEYYLCELCGEYHYHSRECPYVIRGVTNYMYKPRPLFRRVNGETGVCAGIEVEVDHVRFTERDQFIQDVATGLANDTGGWLYCKHDRTAQAFEAVSHPFSWEWYKAHPEMFDKITKLRRLGFKSYNGGNCGIHVHLSKDSFTNMHLYKFMQFIYAPENQEFILAISQRIPNRLQEWANSSNKTERGIIAESKSKEGNGDRHSAVNITAHTVELRIFRGTLRPVSFEKNIEFAFALYDFTRTQSRLNLSFMNFIEFVAKNAQKYRNLGAYINESERIMAMVSEGTTVFNDDTLSNDEMLLDTMGSCDCEECETERRAIRARIAQQRPRAEYSLSDISEIWRQLEVTARTARRGAITGF